MNLPAEIVAQLQGGEGENGFGIWSENWEIVAAFLAVASQWRTIGLATGAVYWMGLDYGAARAGLELADIAVTPMVWAGIKVMEAAARDALNGVRG